MDPQEAFGTPGCAQHTLRVRAGSPGQCLRLPSVLKAKELFLTSFKKKKARLPGTTGRI